MKKENYEYSFVSSRSAAEIFQLLSDVQQWWSGLYNESIKGKSSRLNDEFTFEAGEGIHYSRQKLVELKLNERLVWLVTDSHLAFLKKPDEWTDSKIGFDIQQTGKQTRVTFSHWGLTPQIECYSQCSDAWSSYLKNLEKKLK